MNNTRSIVTDTGDVLVFHAHPEFEVFQTQYQTIGELQSDLPDGVYSSRRIRSRYEKMYEQRDHHRNAAVKQAADWLLKHNVDMVYVGDLKDVLSTHWSAAVNQKTHNFCSHGQVTDQLADTFELAGIELVAVSETKTSLTCPGCGSENVTRCDDDFACTECHVESHADVVGAALMLLKNSDVSVCEWFAGGSMARPAAPSAGCDGEGDYHVT